MSKKKLTLIILAHDGITSLYAGVGTAVNGYFKSIDRLKSELKDYDLQLWGIAPKYAEGNYAFSAKQLEKITKICRSTGGDVLTCFNYSDGWNQYGNMTNWPTASASGATVAYEVIKNEKPDVAIVIGVDTPFAQTHGIIQQQYGLPAKYIGVWMPHSTSLIHERGDYDTKRLEFELKAIKMANESENLFTGFLNLWMREHLEFNYGATNRSLTPILNGIVIDELVDYTQKEIEKAMNEKGIPTDKPIVFSFGRGVPYKGFDLFMKAAKKLDDLPYHFVAQAAPYTMEDPIVKQLESLKHKNITLLLGLDFVFPRQLMQWDNTVLTAVLSKFEPGAFIPAEIRIYGKTLAIVSDKDGLPVQVEDGQDGFITGLDEDEVAMNIRKILEMPKEKRVQIAKKGRELVLDKYDMTKNFVGAIKNLLGVNE